MQPHREPLLPIGPGPRTQRTYLRQVSLAGPPAVIAGPRCSCGHGRQAHEHYRRGRDCALCGCAKFARPLFARIGLRNR